MHAFITIGLKKDHQQYFDLMTDWKSCLMGGIPKGMTKEDFLTCKTNPVNEELMSISLQCDIVEHSGHGVLIVVREYGEKAYEFSQRFITVTIPFDRTGFESQNATKMSTKILWMLFRI